MSARRTAFVIAGAIVAACNGILGIEDRELRGGPTDADASGTDARAQTDGTVPPVGDGGRDADEADGAFDAGRPGLIVVVPGPGGFAIHAHEVTVAEYAAFLADGGVDAGSGSPDCTWKTTNALQAGCSANVLSGQPVVCVDWCDAAAYCKSAGMRLCGRRGGGPHDTNGFADAATDEWTFACAGGLDSDRWCFGPTSDATKCNTSALAAGGMTAVGSLPGCVGGKPGIFDMSGNAWEWENACTDSGTPQNQGCAFRGGSTRNPLNDAKCSVGTFLPRSVPSQDIGIRCCKDL